MRVAAVRSLVRFLVPCAGLLANSLALAATPAVVDYTIKLDVIREGYDGVHCWVHPRAGIVPSPGGGPPSVVLTMQQLWLKGSDVFGPLHEMRTDDLGRTWSGPIAHTDTLGQRAEPNDVTVGVCDFWPKWHAASGRLLGIGHTVRYRDNAVIRERPRETYFSVYDPAGRAWTPWQTLRMPAEARFYNAGAGCVQRVDVPGGDILLPFYFKAPGETDYRTAVARCSFDGTMLSLRTIGEELALKGGRGLYEPSLATVGGRFFLTLRNDTAAYVATSGDGLNFGAPRRWTWDDGTDLGSYNTQAHWVTHGDALFLVYTRRGAGNDHVTRHRAPLFMAQVDPDRLVVLRATERILVPERGARLGNFGVTEVSPTETWVTVAEWMQGNPPLRIIPPDNPWGANNRVYAARIRWESRRVRRRRGSGPARRSMPSASRISCSESIDGSSGLPVVRPCSNEQRRCIGGTPCPAFPSHHTKDVLGADWKDNALGPRASRPHSQTGRAGDRRTSLSKGGDGPGGSRVKRLRSGPSGVHRLPHLPGRAQCRRA